MIDLKQIRYEISASYPIELHRDLPTVTMRGAFGYSLAQILEREASIKSMDDKAKIFREVFKPENTEGTIRNSDPARPYVMRGGFARPDRKSFILEIVIFGKACQLEPLFDKVVENMSEMGLGRANTICNAKKLSSDKINPVFPETDRIVVDFITPARLKHDNMWMNDEIPFDVLFARLANRFNEIMVLYCEDGKCLPYEQANELKNLSRGIFSEKIEGGRFNSGRRSTRTGDEIRLDGFVGKMLYAGDYSRLGEILKYLPWIHVGKSAVLGCGWTTVNCMMLE
ncbi:MAG: CRISPR system precrRNA processing endoribonuclease RAMP protein Cas6 [Lentisphaerota bacterium]